MKRKIEISTHELKCIEEHVEWCFKHPSPCVRCESDSKSCNGCKEFNKWEDLSQKMYDRMPQDYKETFKFLNQVGYINKLLEKMKVDKEIRELRTRQNILCDDINRIQLREGIEISDAGH